MKYLILIFVTLFSVASFGATPPPIPVATLTPGDYDAAVTKAVACHKWRQNPPVIDEDVSANLQSTALAYYAITPSADFTMDYSVPAVLGGQETIDNVWPQATADAQPKNRLEKTLMDRMCSPVSDISIATARAAVDGDWRTGYRTYVSTATPTATNTPIPNTATATQTPTPTATNTNTATNTPTATNTATNTATPTATVTP